MGQVAQMPVLSAEEFIAWENEQVERHEFVNGDVLGVEPVRCA